jgi:hypothetical protein
MASKDIPAKGDAGHGKSGGAHKAPDWADGLKQLYDAVIEEPLPDAFKDLLSRLDDSDSGHES